MVKKLLVLGLIVGLYQNWDRIGTWVSGPSEYEQAGVDVVLYATEWCGYCAKTRKLFAQHGIPYVERDIEKSRDAEKAYRALGGRGVPVVVANGVVVHGYSKERILAAAQAAR